ncbi:MAG: GrpB family protein, partial [Pseudomonadota bacterium]
DPEWPSQYRYEASRLKAVFGEALIDIHHVGSTAIPGSCAKPEIDMLAVVENTEGVQEWNDGLAAMRYRRGGDLSECHLFFKRDSDGVRTHKLHVCIKSHPKITEMLDFRDFLRTHPETCEAYQALKIQLERENTAGIAEYLKGKEPFIRSVLRQLD